MKVHRELLVVGGTAVIQVKQKGHQKELLSFENITIQYY
jgi:hypothetical protein